MLAPGPCGADTSMASSAVLTERALPRLNAVESELLIAKRWCSKDPQRFTGMLVTSRAA
jgi:hypothetical protein